MSDFINWLVGEKHGDHDQSTHGSRGSGGGDISDLEASTTAYEQNAALAQMGRMEKVTVIRGNKRSVVPVHKAMQMVQSEADGPEDDPKFTLKPLSTYDDAVYLERGFTGHSGLADQGARIDRNSNKFSIYGPTSTPERNMSTVDLKMRELGFKPASLHKTGGYGNDQQWHYERGDVKATARFWSNAGGDFSKIEFSPKD